MSQRVVTVMLRVKDGKGNRLYHRAVVASNGSIKPFYALIGGKPEHRPEAIYYLRYQATTGKRRYQFVGRDPKLAWMMQMQRQHIIAGESMGLPTAEAPKGTPPPRMVPAEIPSAAALVHPQAPVAITASDRLGVARIIDKYVREVTALKNRKLGENYRFKLGTFLKTFEKTYLDEIGDDEIIVYITKLRERNLSDRTIKNYCTALRTFLKRHGYSEKLKKHFIPKPTEKIVRAYSGDQLKALFAAANPKRRCCSDSFSGSGCVSER